MLPRSILTRCRPLLSLALTTALLCAARGVAGGPAPEHSGADSSAAALPRTELLHRLGLAPWHTAGHRGKGLKVAILDSGFCGYRAQLGKALPEKVDARSFRNDGNLEAKDSQHVILCGEVVHALAPE